MKKNSACHCDSPSNKKIINGRYLLGEKIGAGAFSKVYNGVELETNREVALKTEKSSVKQPVVLHEGKILKVVHQNRKKEGFPKLYWYGTENGSNFMAFELLGANLESVWKACNKKFSLNTILMLGEQMLNRLECLHECGFVHGDIKPDNFAIGLGKSSSIVYLIDYGLCTAYKSLKTGIHKPYKEGQTLRGNATFASVNNHLGIDYTRRDDLESLLYVLIYLYKGKFLLEDDFVGTRVQKYAKIATAKMETPAELLCKGMPSEFIAFLNYCKELQYNETPDYDYLRSLFDEVRTNKGLSSAKFDWELIPATKKDASSVLRKTKTNLPELKTAESTNYSQSNSFNQTSTAFDGNFQYSQYSVTSGNKTRNMETFVSDEEMDVEDQGEIGEEGITISMHGVPIPSLLQAKIESVDIVSQFPSKPALMPPQNRKLKVQDKGTMEENRSVDYQCNKSAKSEAGICFNFCGFNDGDTSERNNVTASVCPNEVEVWNGMRINDN